MSERIRLNIGSGQRKFANWINIDCQEKWQPDILARGESLPMFDDASVDLIVLHHIVEHYGCNEAVDLLKECKRVLARDGSLLVFVPDMRALAQMWLEGRLDDATYMINVYGAYMGDEADRHKFGYTRLTLYHLLAAAGFDRYGPYVHRKIEGADIAWPAEWVLGVEARR